MCAKLLGLSLVLALPILVSGAGAQETKPLGERLYDVIVAGLPRVFPGYRANHAKGAVFDGRFLATPEASALSAATVFQGQAVPLTIRYSVVTLRIAMYTERLGGLRVWPDTTTAARFRRLPAILHRHVPRRPRTTRAGSQRIISG